MEVLKLACAATTFLLSLSLMLCIEAKPAFPNFTYHRRMSPSLIKQIFNVHSYDKVPEYEVIQLNILSKRSADEQNVIRIHLSAFGYDIHLRLQRNDDLSDGLNTLKVFEAWPTDSGIRLGEMFSEDEDFGTPYIDQDHMAAVTIRHGSDGKFQLEGLIGDDLFIKPAPTNIDFLADYFASDAKSVDENGDLIYSSEIQANGTFFEYSPSAIIRSGVHIVYKGLTKSKPSLQDSRFIVATDDVNNDIDSPKTNENHRKRPAPPLHVWVEVLLLVDFDTYQMHKYYGSTDTQIRRYYVSFLNGVDLRFKTLSDPKINLILSQIIVFKSRDATPYLRADVDPERLVFNGNRALGELARFLYRAQQRWSDFPAFDVAVLLTNLDMCSEELIFCNPDTVGLAYYMGACTVEKEERWMGVAIVEDNGGFDGILTAAHEIGHLLGADHDGAFNILPSTHGSRICKHEDGYIMSHKSTSERIFQWSECSIQQFRRFMNSGKVSCLFNQPAYDNELVESELPGTVLSLDEQCKRLRGTRACAWDRRVCVSLHCYGPNDIAAESCPYGLSPAAEGSSCGENLHCRHGKCVSDSLIYSPAWNMAPSHGRRNRNSTRISTVVQPPLQEDCMEDGAAEFCENYFLTIGHHEACKNSRITEECCYSNKINCERTS